MADFCYSVASLLLFCLDILNLIFLGLNSLQKSDVFWVTEKSSVPSAFKLFTGEVALMDVAKCICVFMIQHISRLIYFIYIFCRPQIE
jgi:hypothetical protein